MALTETKGFTFGKKKEEINQNPKPNTEFLDVNRKVKIVEGNIGNLRRKILINEQNDLMRHKKAMQEQKNIVVEFTEIKKEIDDLKKTLRDIIDELRNLAKREDVDVLKRYMELWNPVNFVTENYVQKLIDEALKKQ